MTSEFVSAGTYLCYSPGALRLRPVSQLSLQPSGVAGRMWGDVFRPGRGLAHTPSCSSVVSTIHPLSSSSIHRKLCIKFHSKAIVFGLVTMSPFALSWELPLLT